VSILDAKPKGVLFVVSSPSGAGKTTLCRRLMQDFPVVFSVSYTTRRPRPSERDGVDYNFVDRATFDAMVTKGEFAEWAEVHGNRYGTTVAFVAQALEEGRDVLFDIDYQGGRQLKARFEQDAVFVFILPPSIDELARRLKVRATDHPEVIETRLAKARDEIEHYDIYQYLVVNEDLEKAYDELRSIYLASRSEKKRRRLLAEQLIQQAKGMVP
jgi:guanylate kinase